MGSPKNELTLQKRMGQIGPTYVGWVLSDHFPPHRLLIWAVTSRCLCDNISPKTGVLSFSDLLCSPSLT